MSVNFAMSAMISAVCGAAAFPSTRTTTGKDVKADGVYSPLNPYSFMPSVQPGTRLGPYEIVSRLGAGGMGEVWHARDTRLDRDVAVKILSHHFAANAQLKIRFEREAKTIS